MAFSKGKRIEDETSVRIIALAANIGCKEGADALTVARLCRELNCDRRVIYNRFRGINEINLKVADRCNEELIKKASAAVTYGGSYYDNFMSKIMAMFAHIYEQNTHFQHYTVLYEMSDGCMQNKLLQEFERMIEDGKAQGVLRAKADSRQAAKNIWIIVTGIVRVLAENTEYKYQEASDTVMYGVRAILEYIKKY